MALDKSRALPIYQKAELIFKLVQSLIASLPEEDDYIQQTKHLMLEDAMIITTKIAGAEGGNMYSIRMTNAAIIRDHAMHLHLQVGSLRFHKKYKDLEYVALIRSEIDAFRLLFIEWVKSFDTNNYYWDEWELFNPPNALRPEENLFNDSDDDFDINDYLDFDEDQ